MPSAEVSLPLSAIVTQQCHYLINMPVIKHHPLCGLTAALKNYYGTVALIDTVLFKGNLTRTKREGYRIVEKMHANSGDPQIAELANTPVLRDKTCLHIGDFLFSRFDGGHHGPAQYINGEILISQDPVALDYLGFQALEQKRQEKGLSTLSLRAKYIQSAAELGLGTNNPDQMEIASVVL